MKFKIGFPCQRHPQPDEYRLGSPSLTYLRSLPYEEALSKLEAFSIRNSRSIYNIVESVTHEPEYFRMLRLGCDVWSAYDTEFGHYDLTESIHWLQKTKALAKKFDIRLSFHPAQFNALASKDKAVVERTIYHLNIQGEIAELVGATDMNIHCWGRGGVADFVANSKYLSDNVRKRLTVENDEFGVGLYALPATGFPVVLDVHHHWINTGKWAKDAEFELAASTWTDRQPKIHYSYPRNCTLTEGWPVLEGSRTKARAHSDLYNNATLNKWIIQKAAKHNVSIMCEAKHKDIARNQLIPFLKYAR